MKTILVPIDFSSAMAGVVAQARELARAFDAELHLVHVRDLVSLPAYPAPAVGFPGMGVAEMGVTGGVTMAVPGLLPEEVPNEKGPDRVAALAEELRHQGLRASVHERAGAVVEEILKLADELSADLIVLGSHGHGSVYNLLVGSVSEGVIKAGRHPVLLVPIAVAAK